MIGSHVAHRLHVSLVHGFGIGTAPGGPAFYHHFAQLMTSLNLTNRSAAMAIDSVVFPLSSPPSWGTERKTEIVTLRTGAREVHSVGVAANHLLCGQPPDGLRRCRPDDAAILAHEACEARGSARDERFRQWAREASQRSCAMTPRHEQ